METKNDNFDALWERLKADVCKARQGERPLIYTDGDTAMGHKYGGHLSVHQGDEDGASMYVSIGRASLSINCQPEDLRAIAAQCLAAAEEVEEAIAEAQAVRPNTTHA